MDASWHEERDRLQAAMVAALADAQRVAEEEGVRPAREYWNRLHALRSEYIEMLPRVPVARSPISGALVGYQIDVGGLDGWYWQRELPYRRVQNVPPGWLMMTGAMRLADPVEVTPFLCGPGPGAPYVVPRLLKMPGIRAVIAQVEVGRNTGWAITYFGSFATSVELENLWGLDRYPVYSVSAEFMGWGEHTSDPASLDFDLAPWLESGRLSWIEPGDDTATLREGVAGCPYVGIGGTRTWQYLKDGNVKLWGS